MRIEKNPTVKVTPNLRGWPPEKNSYARYFQGNLHKLYIVNI